MKGPVSSQKPKSSTSIFLQKLNPFRKQNSQFLLLKNKLIENLNLAITKNPNSVYRNGSSYSLTLLPNDRKNSLQVGFISDNGNSFSEVMEIRLDSKGGAFGLKVNYPGQSFPVAYALKYGADESHFPDIFNKLSEKVAKASPPDNGHHSHPAAPHLPGQKKKNPEYQPFY